MNLGIENETLEFKKTTGELKEAMYSICAILNKHQHGELYFGVKPDGTPIGQVVTEESLREVSQKIKNFIEPKVYPEIRKVVLDGRDCIYVKFEGNQVPYFAYGVARIRVADEDLVMSPEEITFKIPVPARTVKSAAAARFCRTALARLGIFFLACLMRMRPPSICFL